MTAARRIDRQGLLALNPAAFLQTNNAPPDASPKNREIPGLATVVHIRGFLQQCETAGFESYEGILDRVTAACASAAPAVILRINSPGGDVYGMTDCARAVQSRCAEAGKRLVAFVDGEATSAAYAIACVAAEVVVSDTSFVGSVGVIETRVDLTAVDNREGVRFALTTSGDRKADRHVHIALSEAELAVAQQRVDSLAAVFFAHVAACRPQLSVAAVAALQAATFHGVQAVAVGLADRVASFDSLLASVAGGVQPENTMADDTSSHLDAARAALEKVAAGEGADADKAKAALKAMDATGSDDAPADDKGDDASTEDDDAPPPPKKEPADAAASASNALAATVQSLSAEMRQLKAEKATNERQALFAGRQDLAPELIASLKDVPLAQVRAIVANIKPGLVNPLAASAGARGTLGEGQGQGSPVGTHERSAELAAAFGQDTHAPISKVGTKKYFGVMSPDQARAHTAAMAGKGDVK